MAGEGTVRGTFELSVAQPVTALREYRKEAGKANAATLRLSNQMDKIGSRSQAQRVRRFREGELRSLRSDLFDTAAAAELLNVELGRLGRETIRPKVDMRGVDKALAQVELLHERLRALDRERSTPRLGLGGILNPRTGLQGNAGGARASVRAGGATLGTNGINVAGAGLRTVAVAGTAALPVVQALTGAVGALAGSLGAAGVAAAGIGGAGVGGLAVGLGSLTAVAKPAVSRIQDVYKAQTQYNVAQQDTLSVTQANTTATNTMRQSQRQLADAQRAARYAQESLTQSRRDARRALVDMSLAQDQAALGTKRAALELQRARGEARRVMENPNATAAQRADAQLTVQEAQLGLRQARVEKGRTRADYQKARRGGVEKMPAVVQARRARADAQRTVGDAKVGLTQASAQLAAGATQIASAKQKLDQAFARAPKGTRQLIADTIKLRALWGASGEGVQGRKGIDPSVDAAQRNVVRIGQGATNTLTALTPTLGRAGLRSSRAVLREGRVAGRFARGRGTRGFIRQGAGIFDENLHSVEQTGENVASTFYNVTRAARPFLREATHFIDRWTAGWASSTSDVDKTRSSIGHAVDSLKTWARLAGAGGRLAIDIGKGGRQSGDSMVSSLTTQLNTWDRWIRRNPRQVREFFDRTVTSVTKMATALRNIAGTLSNIATLLTPLLDRFSQFAGLAGGLGLATPGVGTLAYGAYRGLRGGGGRGGGRGGMAGALLGFGGGRGAPRAVAPGGGYGVSRAAQTYALQRGAFGASRLGAARTAAGGLLTRGAGPLAMGALRGAGRAYLPVAALMGLLDFTSFDGGIGGRAQNALSGATLGLIPRPLTDAQHADRGQQAAERFTRGLPSSTSFASQRGAISQLRSRIAGNHARAGAQGTTRTVRGGRFGVASVTLGAPTAGERRELATQNAELRKTLADRLAAYRQYRRDRDRMLDERSKGRAEEFFGEFQQGFNRRRKKGVSLQDNMAKTVGGTLAQIRHMRTAGGRELSQMTLDWARKQAAANPALRGQYDRLVKGVEDRFKGLRGNVSVVQGQILDGSRSQWRNIADTISSQARRGVDETSAEFARLNHLAVGALVQMGYGRKDARTILGGLRAGGAQRTHARNAINMGANRFGGAQAQNRRNATQGDGTGVRHGGTGAAATAGSSALKGAKPGLGVYAAEGSRYGLSVSSGLRAGAVTLSGNTSLHSTGDAIDELGSPGNMLRYAKHMASKYGRGLDELIHTPLGFGIKNGKRVPLSFWGSAINAQHEGHVHVGDRTPGGGARGLAGMGAGGGLGSAPQVAARASRLGGVPGALSTAAGKGYGAAINARLRAAASLDPSLSGLGGFTSGGGGASANQRLGRRMMLAAGFGPDQWPALKSLWTGESGWNEKIVNTSSGATGIPQALPGSKMASAGADWRTNAATQIRWGLGYIRDRYGSPASAYSQWLARSPHWYGKGGQGVYRRPTMIGVGDAQPSGGSEEVTVRRIRPGGRRGRSSGGMGSINLTVDLRGAVIKGEDDARQIIEKAVEKAGHKLLDVIKDAVPDGALT